MKRFTTPLALSAGLMASFGLVAATAAPANAVAITTFDFTGITPINTPLSQYKETKGSIPTTITINNAIGTSLPAIGGVSGNTSGICFFLQNSSGAGNSRCGFIPANGGSDSTSVSSLDLEFDRAVFIKSFDVFALNNIDSATITFGSTPFNITGTGVNNFTSDFLVPANTPFSVVTSSVSFSSGSSGAIRIDNITVEDVPGPLPLLGFSAAFVYARKLRSKVS